MVEGDEEIIHTKGFGWRVSLSILVGVGWLIFLVMWLAFYAGNYNWEKNVAILLFSVLAVGLVLGAPWTIWGMKYRKMKEHEMWKTKGFKWRCWLSMIIAFVLFIFLIIWFWYFAEPYNVYQNIAILIVSLLIVGGVMGAAWAPWGMKHGKKFEDM